MSPVHSRNSICATRTGFNQRQSFILSAVRPAPSARSWRRGNSRALSRLSSAALHEIAGGITPSRFPAARPNRNPSSSISSTRSWSGSGRWRTVRRTEAMPRASRTPNSAGCAPPQPISARFFLRRSATVHSERTGNSFGPNRFSIGSSRQVSSSKYSKSYCMKVSDPDALAHLRHVLDSKGHL